MAQSIGLPEEADGFAYVRALNGETGVPIPAGLKGLEEKPVRHKGVIEKDRLEAAVLDSLK